MPAGWEQLLVTPATAYVGAPSRGGDGVWTAPLFHSTWYLVTGEARVERARDRWTAGPGQGLILPPGWRRHQSFAPGTVIVSLGLRVAWPDGGDALAQAAPVAVPDAAALAVLARAVIDLHGPHDREPVVAMRHRAALAGYAAAWLSALLANGVGTREPGSGDQRIGRIAAELRRSPRLGAIDWEGLRAVAGLSRPQLDRLCRGAHGVPVRGLRDRLVLDRARELLADPRRNLAGIAAELGATDASHFVKWFRRCTGRTPGTERRRAV